MARSDDLDTSGIPDDWWRRPPPWPINVARLSPVPPAPTDKGGADPQHVQNRFDTERNGAE